jgi:hypothetical protein
MKNTKQTTANSIKAQVTDSMRNSFDELRQVYTKDVILSHLEDFASRKARKAWLTKRINDRVVYLNLLHQASTIGWKHFYGQPIHQKFVELQMSTLQSMIEIRLTLSPQSEREALKEAFLRPLFDGSEAPSQPEVVTEKPKAAPKQPKQAPKQAPKQESAPKQPKVEKSTTDNQVILELTKSVTALATQMAHLTALVQQNSVAIKDLQRPIVYPEIQPTVVKKAKVEKVAVTQPKVETKVVVTPKQPMVEKKESKPFSTVLKQVESGQISLFDAFMKTNAPKPEKKGTISHDEAFNHSSDVEKSAWRKFRMEVK